MSGELYCEPCKKLLCGDVEPILEFELFVKFSHHPHIKSLQNALELPCSICSLAWNPKACPPFSPDSTSYSILGSIVRTEISPGSRLVVFYCEDGAGYRSEQIAFVPWKDMTYDRLPPMLSHNTRSSAALDFIIGKYRECRNSHAGCGLQTLSTAMYPARIIDVGKSRDSIYLHDTAVLDDPGPYTCLSHCWGDKQPLMLTKETKPMLHEGILVSALPKTFQDAIFVTQLLGIRFLWIDSLCIMQDGKADWAIEAGRMRDIYSRAACTIAATSANNSDGGLFFERNPTALQPRTVHASWSLQIDQKVKEFAYPLEGSYLIDNKEFYYQSVVHAPLNLRAWVCQERHLSPRILHFSDTQLFWECHEGVACENYPGWLPKWAMPPEVSSPSGLKQHLHQLRLQTLRSFPEDHENRGNSPSRVKGAQTHSELYFSWVSFRMHYTLCALTKETDKLVAIQGMAQQLGEVLGDELVAGMWRNRLPEELCWLTMSPYSDPVIPRSNRWRAPTWSWASLNTQILGSQTAERHRICDAKQIWIQVDKLDVKAHISGELEYASLRIQCTPIAAIIKRGVAKIPSPFRAFEGLLSFERSLVELQVPGHGTAGKGRVGIWLDDFGMDGSQRVQLIIVQRCSHSDFNEWIKDCVEGLVLTQLPGEDGVFERVGLFAVEGSTRVRILLDEHKQAESKIITLI